MTDISGFTLATNTRNLFAIYLGSIHKALQVTKGYYVHLAIPPSLNIGDSNSTSRYKLR